jgi:hypothetical protein
MGKTADGVGLNDQPRYYLRPRQEAMCAGNSDPEEHGLNRVPLHWPLLRCGKCGAWWNPETERWVAYASANG